MLHSLRFRFFAALLLVVVVVAGTVALFASRATTREFQRYVESGGVLRSRRLQALLAMHYERSGGWNGVQPLVEQMGKMSGERIVLADAAKRVIADSNQELIGRTVSQDWAGPAALITWGGVPIGILYVRPTGGPPIGGGELNFLHAVNRWLLIAAFAAVMVAIVLTFMISHQIVSPVEALTAAARKMEKGDLSQRVQVQSNDEVGELAHAFNAMANGLTRLEELRRSMVSDVAHELRTPLSNIRGQLEAIRDGLIQPNMEVIDSLYEETMMLNRLVDDLQELALAEAGQLKLIREPVAVAQVISKVTNATRPRAASKGLTLEIDVPNDLPIVEADAGRVAEILQNLLNNAIAYTPQGGKVTVLATAAGSEVKVSVRDTGIGIAPEHLPHVFERFYRVDKSRTRATGGAGLGLAIVKQLVEAHGGRVWAESTPGQGSTFTFTLPILSPAIGGAAK